MISEKEIISEGKNSNNQRTHSSSSGKSKDTLITQFLKPVDKNESDLQLERLRKMHELESRCGKYKTRVYGYVGMTSDCTVSGLCDIFMRD